MYFAGLDVGTTCCKCQLIDERGNIVAYHLKEYELKKINGQNYIDIDVVWQNIKSMLKHITKVGDIKSIAVASLGESFVALDRQDNILFYPMLYTDSRGEEESQFVKSNFSTKKLFEITGTTPSSMYSIYKMLWIKKHHPEIFAKIDKILLVGDYINYKLSGHRVIDYSLASRTGAFDIAQKRFSSEVLTELGLPLEVFSKPVLAGKVIGNILPTIADELNINNDCIVVTGAHDQVCSAIGAGVTEAGMCVDGMGTVECITVVGNKHERNFQMGLEGYTCTPYAVGGCYCSYLLNYTCGALVNWFRKILLQGFVEDGENFFSYHESRMSLEPTGLICLPYFSGAATPFQDINAKGAIINLQISTTPSDIYKSIMEGTSYEMRLNLENMQKYGMSIKSLIATGGGSNSRKWLQIKADILGVEVYPLLNSEAGVCGSAMLGAVAVGQFDDLDKAKKVFVKYGEVVKPNPLMTEKYNKYYQRYKKTYKLIKELY